MQKKCKICSQYFVPDKFHPHQKICSTQGCQLERRKRYKIAYDKLWRKNHPDYYKKYMKEYHKL